MASRSKLRFSARQAASTGAGLRQADADQRGAPYDMMIFLAGLPGIDRGLYKAATVDAQLTHAQLRRASSQPLA